jgi:hypothetical protein
MDYEDHEVSDLLFLSALDCFEDNLRYEFEVEINDRIEDLRRDLGLKPTAKYVPWSNSYEDLNEW